VPITTKKSGAYPQSDRLCFLPLLTFHYRFQHSGYAERGRDHMYGGSEIGRGRGAGSGGIV